MSPHSPSCSPGSLDPFSTGALTYSTTGADIFPSPSYHPSRKHSWIHIFPEGRVHQHPSKTVRYFKWGVSRLILESEPCPEIIPIFIDGNQEIMHENRQFPRFVPRIGKNIKIVFGESVDSEELFGELRSRWKDLVRREKEQGGEMGVLMSEVLRTGKEAVEIRAEVTRRVRNEVLKVRRSLGYDDEDPKQGLVETWIEEGNKKSGKMEDGSWVGTT
jgi:monolysocardiolipin acyltransferase